MQKLPLFFAFILSLCSMFSLVPRQSPSETKKTYEPDIGKHFESTWRYIENAVDKYYDQRKQ